MVKATRWKFRPNAGGRSGAETLLEIASSSLALGVDLMCNELEYNTSASSETKAYERTHPILR